MAERMGRSLLAAVVLSLAALAGVPASGAVAAAEPTGACRSVDDGSTQTGGGPQRATVVVDTGTGPVWSACIFFSGTISGIAALDLASRSIPGLDPVYDLYAGQGRAVCRLLGVGNDPPDCLGKTEDYWAYHHNGRYSSLGAGGMTVADGDVEGWRWGSGSAPRRATRGSEAIAWTPPPPTTEAPRPTAPPATASPQPAPTAAPPVAAGPDGGGTPTTVASPSTTTATGSSTTSPPVASTTPTSMSSTTTSTAVASGDEDDDSDDDESAVAPLTITDSEPGSSGRGVGWASAAGFVSVVAVVTGLGLFRRSRRPSPA